MSEYNNELRGALFKNDNKTEERDPDYTGTVQVKEQAYFLDAWIQESKAGRKFMSLRLKPRSMPPRDQ